MEKIEIHDLPGLIEACWDALEKRDMKVAQEEAIESANSDSILGDGSSACLKCNGYGTLPMTLQMQRSGGCGWSVPICDDCGGSGIVITRRQSSSRGRNTNS